jgi:energy-coupling factor transporter ATP-binding protein EcfA2
MPKRITAITIDNYRSWFGVYEPIILPRGENLLIYGENGSGKSSLFKGIQNFFRSSQNGLPVFELNRFSVVAGNTSGSVEIEFTDATLNPPKHSYLYTLGGASTNTATFIKATRNLNSFLDYKHLLSVHFSNPDASSVPDLFASVVEGLLGEFVIPSTRTTVKFEIDQVESGLKRRLRSSPYVAASLRVPLVQGAISTLINDVLAEANRLLVTYFDNLEIQLSNFRFDIDPNASKSLRRKFEIQIRYAGEVVANYNYFLNEARLSAIAICFYLASIKSHPPAGADYKILFLDDVFVGLDTSNRIPLLELLKSEFAEYQIFVSTYDRQWYEVAKEWFGKHMPGNWLQRELYVHKGEHITGRPPFDKAISVEAGSLLGRALYHLNATNHPDYPAAANYLRKYAEQVLKKYIPEIEYKQKDENTGEFPDFIMLNDMMKKAQKFLTKINQNDSLLVQLKGHSKRLLNPLSHYNPSTPIFKKELDDVVGLLPTVEAYLKDLSQNVYRLSLNERSVLRMKLAVSPTVFGFYEVRTMDQLYLYRDGANLLLSNPPVKSSITYTIDAGVRGQENKYRNDYPSLSEAYDLVHAHVATLPGMNGLRKEANWINAFEYLDSLGNWQALNSLLAWP